MRNIIWLTILLSNFAIANNGEICELNNNEIKFADMTDSYIYKDKDFSPESAAKSLKLLTRYFNGENLKHFIPENHATVINGALLQDKIRNTKHRLDKAKKDKYEKVVFELEVQLLKRTNNYCNYLRTNYHIDW